MDAREQSIHVSAAAGDVSALVATPRDAWAAYVLAHGAGAGMRHPFLGAVAASLFDAGVATLRYQFPYMEAGRKRPDPPAVCAAAVRAAIEAAGCALPLIAGGKSFGGRMTSQAAAAAGGLPGVRGIFFLGFPLHPAGKPATARGDHLAQVALPMLFLQGTRDELAAPELLRPLVAGLGARATLHEIEGADHGFHVPARSGRKDADVLDELADRLAGWASSLFE
jgi:hypothetical protein